MSPMYPLVQMITHFTVLSPRLSHWEACASSLIQKHLPSSVSFFCDSSGQHCPVNSFYGKLQIPYQTFLGAEKHKLPFFRRQDMVFIVDDKLTEWSDQAVEKYRRNGKNDFKLVIISHRRAFEDDFKAMADFFAAMWLSGIVRCAAILVNNTSSDLYTYIPFLNSSSCEDTTPILIGKCSEGAEEVFDLTYKVHNFNRCPLRIALSGNFPNNSLYGQSSPLMREIPRRMNANLEIVNPTDGAGGLCGREEQKGLRGLVYNGTVHMGYGSLGQKECATLGYIGMAHMYCLSWCTPVLSANDYVYFFLLKQLQPKVWLSLIISVLAVLVSVAMFCAVLHEDWTGSDVFKLSVTAFAQLPPLKLRATSARIVAGLWLWASLVLRAVYEGEMKSNSAVHLGTHIIHDIEELIESDLLLCGSMANMQLLKDVDIPVMQRLYEKTKVCKGTLDRNLMMAGRQKDRAVLATRGLCLEVAAELSQNKVLLYSRTGGCFKTFQMSPIVTLRGSPFVEKWGKLLNRCVQAGFISKWLYPKPHPRERSGLRRLSVAHLLPALFVLGLGSLGGVLLLFGERIYNRWSRRKPRHFDCS